jgi:hypothetical protein
MQNSQEEVVPSKEEFLVFFNETFPKGNPKNVYTTLEYYVKSKLTFVDTPVTWSLIKEKYKAYIEECNEEQRPEKYIKGLEKFITDEDFNNSFGVKRKGTFLDKYSIPEAKSPNTNPDEQ